MVLIVFILVSLAVLVSFFIIKGSYFFGDNTPLFFKVFFSLFFLYMLLSLIFGELRSKVIVVFIWDTFIEKKGFGGIGYKIVFKNNEIEGYTISNISSKLGICEFLYVIKNKKKVVKIS